MKTKICEECGKEFILTSGRQKYCLRCRVAVKKEHQKQRYKDRIEYMKEYHKQWYKDHKDKIKENNKQYCKDHREEKKEAHRQYHQTHEEEIKEYKKQYKQTPTGKEVHKRMKAKRKGLGFIPLNSYFEGSVGHHMNKMFVVYIPEGLHTSVSHNIWTGKNMAEINFKVLEFLDV